MLVQEWVHGIEYKKRILAFLYKIDDIMVPALRGRVDISSYAEKISQKAETIFISENGEDIASCSVYCNTENGFITSIAVKSKYIRRHIGTELIENVKQRVYKLGCRKILLEVYDQNDAAICFYKKVGFTITRYEGEWIEMECLLDFDGMRGRIYE